MSLWSLAIQNRLRRSLRLWSRTVSYHAFVIMSPVMLRLRGSPTLISAASAGDPALSARLKARLCKVASLAQAV